MLDNLHLLGKQSIIAPMTKAEAIAALGGTQKSCAQAIGVTRAAVQQWPELLTARISDRVVAAIARQQGAIRDGR
jgi:DNA-binding transcriptional regulator YdaS (Cro superfamily)